MELITITIHRTASEEDKEHKWALFFKRKFEKDSRIRDSKENNIHIISSVQCYGETPRDVDLVIWGDLGNYANVVDCEVYNLEDGLNNRVVTIKNFFINVEVKGVDLGIVKIESGNVRIYRSNKEIPEDATIQARDVMWSLKNYLEKNKCGSPHICNLVSLPEVSSEHFQNNNVVKDMNVLFSDFTTNELWRQLFLQRKPYDIRGSVVYDCTARGQAFNSDKYQKVLACNIEFSNLDRIRVENICKDQLKNESYMENLGGQLLIFKGQGGTGKTYRLLSLAKNIYERKSGRTLILTYHVALVSDITRLLALMRIKDGTGESIHIKTIHKYWYEIITSLGIAESDNYDINNFDDYKDQLRDILFDQKREIELKRLANYDSNLFSWDYIMIDEAQDWPEDERDLIYKLFGPNKIIIADGMSQLVRTNKPCNWRNSATVKDSKVKNLERSLRQKHNLTKFIAELISKSEILNWDVEHNEEMYGGRVIIIEGKFTKSIHSKLVQMNTEDKNRNLDMLFCVPPENIDHETSGNSKLGKQLEEWGYGIWDGVQKDVRKSMTYNLDDFRIIQYDSSRGLEGWICVNIGFDQLFQYKYAESPEEPKDSLWSEEDAKKYFAMRWLLIPLTRAIDTIVIQIEDPEHYISKILRDIYESYDGDYIEWISN